MNDIKIERIKGEAMNLDREEPKVKSWIERITNNGNIINSLTPLSIQKKSDNSLLFAYINADVTALEGYKLLPIIFLRGDAVIIVPKIINRDTGEIRYLTVEQRRIASGGIHLEFPAGMVDEDTHNPAGVAIKELEEETGLSISSKNLIQLTEKPLYTSPGASDERLWFFGVTVEVSSREFSDLDNRLRGEISENEHITTKLVTKDEFVRRNESTQALLALILFEESSRKNR